MRQKVNINMAERFDKILKAKGITNIRSFEQECKISNNQVSKILLKGKCRTDTLAKILLHPKFENINPLWLLTGLGEMEKAKHAVEAQMVAGDSQARREINMLKKDVESLRDEILQLGSFIDGLLINNPGLLPPKKTNPNGSPLQKDRLHYAITM
jgi:HAMP domain-containing protein